MLYFGIHYQIESCCYFYFKGGESLTPKLNRIKRFAYFVCVYNFQQTPIMLKYQKFFPIQLKSKLKQFVYEIYRQSSIFQLLTKGKRCPFLPFLYSLFSLVNPVQILDLSLLPGRKGHFHHSLLNHFPLG